MTEACALHLSFIVACHDLPETLLKRVPRAKAGLPAQQLNVFDESPCRGIVYLRNPSLGQAGSKVLELAELIRSIPLDKPQTAETQKLSDTSTKHSAKARRISGAHSNSGGVGAAIRRRSLTLGNSDRATEDTGVVAESELERARNRIQGNILHDEGPRSTNIWCAALRMLTISRNIQPQREHGPKLSLLSKIKPPIVKTLNVPVINPRTPKALAPLTVHRGPNQVRHFGILCTNPEWHMNLSDPC